MPELPEVETVKRGLLKLIVGRKLVNATTDNPKSFQANQNDVDAFLNRSNVIDVRRRAKVLMIDLSTGYSLVIHLKMTGQVIFVGDSERFAAGHPNDSLINKLPDKSTRITFVFEDGSQLFFNDQRKFGWVKLMPTAEIMNLSFMQKVGPEPLESHFTLEQFKTRFIRRPRTNIKAALLDQSVIAGVGNIYADEALWGARLHPRRLVGSLSDDDYENLYNDVRAVMMLSIEKGGSTNRNYVDAEGKKGSYMDFARVFRREGLLCPRCGDEIVKMRVAGRGTHICPSCQVI
jgi:formamidopyrimidine-DNA glycosylase